MLHLAETFLILGIGGYVISTIAFLVLSTVVDRLAKLRSGYLNLANVVALCLAMLIGLTTFFWQLYAYLDWGGSADSSIFWHYRSVAVALSLICYVAIPSLMFWRKCRRSVVATVVMIVALSISFIKDELVLFIMTGGSFEKGNWQVVTFPSPLEALILFYTPAAIVYFLIVYFFLMRSVKAKTSTSIRRPLN